MSVKKTMARGCTNALTNRDNEPDPPVPAQPGDHPRESGTQREEWPRWEDAAAMVKQLPPVETGPYFTARVMGKIIEKEKEKKRRRRSWFPLPSPLLWLSKTIYATVFIIFMLLGVWLGMKAVSPEPVFPAGTDGGRDGQREPQMVRVLVESRDLSLINVQEQTIAMLSNGNGGKREK